MNATAETFNWEQLDTTTKFGVSYTPEERTSLTQLYEEKLTAINEYEVVMGTVVGVSNRDVIVNIGAKSDGLISLNEFRDMPDLQPGNAIEVYIEEQENAKGQLVLSRKKAKLVRGWEKIQHAQDSDQVIEGFVKRRTKGGLIVDIYGVESFLPGSQIDVRPIRDFDAYVGKNIDVAVVKINYANENVVVSHKVLIEKSLEHQKVAIIGNLEKGQILEGIVKNIAKFGVFIDLGGVDGLLHITDISWGRITHPEEALELGQKVKVVVTDFDEEKKRISLGMKQLLPHPWEQLPENIQVGAIVKGKIVKIKDFFAILEVLPGIEGLIHISAMSWSQHLSNVKDIVQEGDEIEAMVLTLIHEEKRMTLGIKQLTTEPWEKPELFEQYGVGTKHTGVIRDLKPFGAFVELEPGLEGLVRTSDLSWTQKVNHPSEVVKIDDKIETIVLEIDKENRKLTLGLKQLAPNPWDTYEETFQIDTIHAGTVTQKLEKGALVALADNVEGFVPKRHMTKEDGQLINVGEVLDFRVLDFAKANNRIVLSHTATFAPQTEDLKTKPSKQAKFPEHTGNLMTAENSTLGDIDALANLRDQIIESDTTPEALQTEEATSDSPVNDE